MKAFGLVGAAIALIVMSIFMTFGIRALSIAQKVQRNKTTSAHVHLITSALAAYVGQHGRLPCPASPPTASGATGEEEKFHHDSEGGRCRIQTGLVPFRALGIGEQEAKDGEYNWFLYAPDPNGTKQLTNPNILEVDLCIKNVENDHKNQIILEDSSPLNVKSTRRDKHFYAFVLISFGPDGRGAFGKPSQNLTPEEKENIDNNLTFYTKAPAPFAHRVYWMTRNNFISTYFQRQCFSTSSAQRAPEKVMRAEEKIQKIEEKETRQSPEMPHE